MVTASELKGLVVSGKYYNNLIDSWVTKLPEDLKIISKGDLLKYSSGWDYMVNLVFRYHNLELRGFIAYFKGAPDEDPDEDYDGELRLMIWAEKSDVSKNNQILVSWSNKEADITGMRIVDYAMGLIK